MASGKEKAERTEPDATRLKEAEIEASVFNVDGSVNWGFLPQVFVPGEHGGKQYRLRKTLETLVPPHLVAAWVRDPRRGTTRTMEQHENLGYRLVKKDMVTSDQDEAMRRGLIFVRNVNFDEAGNVTKGGYALMVCLKTVKDERDRLERQQAKWAISALNQKGEVEFEGQQFVGSSRLSERTLQGRNA